MKKKKNRRKEETERGKERTREEKKGKERKRKEEREWKRKKDETCFLFFCFFCFFFLVGWWCYYLISQQTSCNHTGSLLKPILFVASSAKTTALRFLFVVVLLSRVGISVCPLNLHY